MATEQTKISASCFLPEAMIEEILVRLPTKALVRCRAVSKSWRRLATDRHHLLDHHSRQPTQPLITMFIEGEGDRFPVNCLEAIDLGANKRRTILRLIDKVDRGEECNLDFDIYYALTVHGSCDGLLLLSYDGIFFIWNPITRQCALLPSLNYDDDDVAGFYRHAASGEYRVLYRKYLGQDLELEREYYVLTVGSQQTRNIGRRPSPAWVVEHITRGLHGACVWPPVLLDGSLHCPPPQQYAGDILVFHTDAESFRCIPSPEAAKDELYRLFEMEGKLAMFCWMKNTWISCRIELSPLRVMGMDEFLLSWDPPIVYKEGDMLLEGGWKFVLHYDKGQLQGSFDCDVSYVNLTPHVFKESLVLHEFLQTQQNGVVADPPFSEGSSNWLIVP